MKKLLLFLFCYSVWPVLAQNAMPFCSSMTTQVHVQTSIGNPKYISLYSKKEFLKKNNRKFDPHTLGLTVVEMGVEMQAKPSVTERAGQFCVGLADVDIKLYYPVLTVYIDKKYEPSSCEYQIIKSHENYHVAVAQQAMSFYKKDVEQAAYKALERQMPKVVTSQQNIQATVNQLSDAILNDLNPVIQHINQKLVEKNAAIDTPEMYKATTAKCSDW